jgi:hypothetical protein
MSLAIELRREDWARRHAVAQVVAVVGNEPTSGIVGALLSEDQMALARQILDQAMVPYKHQLTEGGSLEACNGADWQ